VSVNVFDQAARYSAQRLDPIGFLRWAVQGLDPSLRFLDWLDARTLPFPGSPDRTCDTVANVAGAAEDGPRWALVVEFQTEPDAKMLDRLLEYLAMLRRGLRSGPDRRERYRVVAALIGLTGPPQPDTLEMALPGLTSPSLLFRAASRTLRDEDAAATLDLIDTGQLSMCLLCWISLMRGGGDPDIIERWREVASREPKPSRRADYGAIVSHFAVLSKREAQWRAGLEGWDMLQSPFVEEWKAEGRAEGQRIALLELLETRFGTPIPSDLVTTIEGQADIEILSRWFKSAIRAKSLKAFRAELTR
jgi:hypothetical protein